MTRRLYSVREAATYLGCGQSTIRREIRHRRLPCVRLGRRLLVDVRDLDAAIEAARVPARAGRAPAA